MTARKSKTVGSMTRRLIIAVTGVAVIFWLAAAGFGIAVMHDEFSEIFDSSLQETAERLLPLVADDLQQGATLDVPRRLEARTEKEDEYLVYQARDASGKVLLHSHDSGPEPFSVPLKAGFADTETHRVYTAVTRDGSLFVQIADPLDHRREALFEGGIALLLPLLILIPANIIVIWMVIGRMLRPVQTLRASIAEKDSGNMAAIDQADLPPELQPIGHSVNLLLDRLRSALEAEREFTANSAHELRTPIAGALAQTQRLAAEVPDAVRPRVSQVERSLVQLSRLSEKLLQLSRAEAGIGMTESSTDLINVLTVVVEDLGRSPAGRDRIHMAAGDNVTIIRNIDADAFAIMIRNLLENALIHSPAGSSVEMSVTADGGIDIRNHGQVLDPRLLETITGRFVRGATTARGSGLGLSIVLRLVGQVGGTIEFISPATGWPDGLQVRLCL
jgi:two-component system OmpR family sensor kinase